MAKKIIDPATLVLFTQVHCQEGEHGAYFKLGDIDRLMLLAKEFDKRFGAINWDESESDWESSVCTFYRLQFKNPNFK